MMRGLPEEEQSLAIEALEQCKALIEMALEADTIVGVYETARVTISKLMAVEMAIVNLIPFLVSSGEFTAEELATESHRVGDLIQEFVNMRLSFREDDFE